MSYSETQTGIKINVHAVDISINAKIKKPSERASAGPVANTIK